MSQNCISQFVNCSKDLFLTNRPKKKINHLQYEGHFAPSKKGVRLFQNKRIFTDFDGIFLKTKDFAEAVYQSL